MSTFLWVVFPYLCIAAFVVGLIWRWRYDQFGWTTRSSQLYESKLLKIGSPLFHFALLAVLMRQGAVQTIGPFPAVAALLFAGMVGVMLVFTDLMVRGLYAQIGAAKRAEDEGE